jgi:phosphoribosylanthranilate isomerase
MMMASAAPQPPPAHRVRVKICGITRSEDALLAAQLGADALGFNFWPKSKRFIEPEAARAIVAKLPPFVVPVGVFVNQTEDEIRAAAARAGVEVIQLHGDESPEFCTRFDLPVLKAIRVEELRSLAALASYEVNGFLLDTPSRGFGGSGRPFDWTLAEGISECGSIILAGGLTPENVAAAIQAVRPWAVDVASGVESSPGVKDPAKLIRFIQAAKEILT